jgi:O-antigen ligase/polysaccharide polymerase Wzy-like membrane protein
MPRTVSAETATTREPLWTLAWFAASLSAAAAVGVMLGRGEIKFAILPLAAALVLLLASVPAAPYVAILWSVGTVVDMLALPEVSVSSLLFVPAEILLWLALGSLAFLSRDMRRALAGLARRRESVVVGIFLAAVLGGVAVGMENGASLHTALFDMRLMLFYAAFWPALAALIWNRDSVFKLVAAGVVAVVVLQIFQVIVGPSTHLFVIARSDLTSTLSPEETGFLRVRPPGLTTVYIVAAFALARVLWGPVRQRLLGWAMAAVALTGVILSLNRNMLLGLALGLCVAALIARQKHRFVVLVATVGVALSGFALLAQGSSLGSDPVVSRIASITNYSGLRQQTLNDRYYENTVALQRIRAHPIGGLGWGPDYGATLLRSAYGVVDSQPRPFMHEQYLWIWLRAGLVGLLALIAMLAFGIHNGARWCRARHGNDDAWLGAGVLISLIAVAASSNVAIYLTPPDSTVPLVGVLALAAVMRRDLACS